MIRLVKSIFVFITYALAGANIICVYKFWKWIKELEFDAATKFDFSSYLAVQAHQNGMLQTYLILMSIGLTVLAFYGYYQIRDSAGAIAEKKAMEIAKAIVEQYITEHQNQLNLGSPSFPSDPKQGVKKRAKKDKEVPHE